MAHILVTGGAGFIGSHLCARLLIEGHRVLSLDNFNNFYDPRIKQGHEQRLQALDGGRGRYTSLWMDICHAESLNQLFRECPIDLVIHLAGMAGVRPSTIDPVLYTQVNVQGTITLLECCRSHHIPKCIFGSSSSVYGARQQVPFREEDATDRPASPYAATKRAGELFCSTYADLYRMQIICLRFFTVYGPWQRPDLAIHTFARQMMAGEPITIFGDGSTQRDYTYVEDTVEGIMLATMRLLTRQDTRGGGCETFNIGSAHPITLIDLITHMEEALGVTAIRDYHPAHPGDVPMTYASLDRAKTVLGYQPVVDLTTGLRHFASWFLAESPRMRASV